MDFMENLKRAVTDTAYAAVKKTEDIVETSKTKYSIYDLKNEVEKLYTDIGREVYESYRDDRNITDVVEEKCAAISELMQKMDILKQKLDK